MQKKHYEVQHRAILARPRHPTKTYEFSNSPGTRAHGEADGYDQKVGESSF